MHAVLLGAQASDGVIDLDDLAVRWAGWVVERMSFPCLPVGAS